ncbi:recombinase family protein [Georgenia sp. 10Sc9-8]|uniref:Recombinase family protein n=1 Tax=Georgenia halotolerans TaxID=3028317 RepID=A0ABT5TXX4_9MICO|nr:recombinase family protein [Georgenia halotolerans]
MATRRSVAIYARISQDRGGEGLGVDRQLQDCREKTARLGWTVADEYVDNDISAYDRRKKRPAYERMLADIAAGERDAVVVYHIDRLHRAPIELERFVDVCSIAGVKDLKTVSGDYDLGTGDGLLHARLLGIVAAAEGDAKSRRGKRKMREKAENGQPHGGGMRPFGFEKDQITHHPEEAAVIREAASRALAGESLTSLVRWLDEADVRTVTGRPWATTTLRQLLTNPRNWGVRTYKGAEPVKAVWEPIIDPADGARLRSVLLDPSRRTNRTARRYLLSGLGRCGRCGEVLVSHPKRGVRKYECRTSANHKGCGKISITAELLEEWVVEAVLHALDSPAMAQSLAPGSDDTETERIRAEVTRLRQRQEELAEMYADGEIDRAGWSTARNRMQNRVRDLDSALAGLTRRHAADPYLGKGEELRQQWEQMNLDRQVAIVKSVLNHVTVLPATVPGRHGLDPARVQPDWRR